MTVVALLLLSCTPAVIEEEGTPPAQTAAQHNERGITLSEEGHYEQAISELNKAIELDPKLAIAYYNRGVAYYGKSELTKAASDLEKSIELSNVPQFVKKAQQILDELSEKETGEEEEAALPPIPVPVPSPGPTPEIKQDLKGATFVVAASDSIDKSKADYISDGINDAIEINQAFYALPEDGGQVVLLEGTYNIQAGVPIVIPSNTWLRGQGHGTRIVSKVDVSGSIITNSDHAGGNENIRISDLYVTSVSGVNFGIYFRNVKSSRVDHIWVDGPIYSAIQIGEGSEFVVVSENHIGTTNLRHIGLYGDHLTAIGNTITQSGGSSEGITSVGNYNVIKGNNFKGLGDSIVIGGKYNLVEGNVIEDSADIGSNGILVSSASYLTIQGNIIKGVGYVDGGMHGIYLYKDSKHILIQGNSIIQTPGYGGASSRGIELYLDAGKWPEDVTIVGNEIAGWKHNGIRALGDLSHPMKNIVITGNQIYNNGGGIQGSTLQNSIIQGNSIYSNGGVGVHLSNAYNTLVTGNHIFNNGTWGVEVIFYYTHPDWIPQVTDNIIEGNQSGSVITRPYGG